MRVTNLAIGAAAFCAAVTASPAAACSDLANICEMQAQHFREMMDIAATPPWDSGEDQYEDDGSSSEMVSAPRWTQEQWAAHAAAVREQEAIAEAEHQRRIETEPGYRDFYNGWWIPQDGQQPESGASCMLHFARKGQGVILMGPSAEYKGAMLGFYGWFVPNSRSLKTISMTLVQDDEPAQTLKVFNSRAPWMGDKVGMVFFAVPDIESALAGMSDDMHFELRDPKTQEMLMAIRWHSGFENRDAMRACVARQQAAAG